MASGGSIVYLLLLLLLSYGLVLVRSTLVLHGENAVAVCPKWESCTRYFGVEETYPLRNKSLDRLRQRRDEFMRKLQKIICEKIYSLIKMRLGVKKLNIDSPCND